MVCSIKSFGINGIDAFEVTVEVDFLSGLPRIDMAGLPDTAIKESRDRINSAITNSGYEFPRKRFVINLAPADRKKEGPVYDLPILIAVLKASEQLNVITDSYAFAGEVALDGKLRGITGALSMVIHAKEMGYKAFFLPKDNACEAAVVVGITVYGAENLRQVCEHLEGKSVIAPATPQLQTISELHSDIDFSDVRGQTFAKKALEIAAAGGHSVLLVGPPGTGKSMLAKRVPTILPPMTFEESIQISKIHSVAGLLRSQKGLVTTRPFRAPHHSVSPAGLSGGGSTPMPGEISLAHNGVLFLDEFPEFSRSAIETLRQPMEDGVITISRARSRITYPCNIMVIAAMNPCPCGYLGHPTKPCICTKQAANRYFSKISGPMLDRLDLQTEVLPVDFDTLSSSEKPESSSEILKRVTFARNIQQQRFLGTDVTCNASMSSAMTAKYCTMSEQANTFLRRAFDTLGLSPRAYDRILRVSRTIADLDGCDNIEISHISLAVQYRSLDRKYFTKA